MSLIKNIAVAAIVIMCAALVYGFSVGNLPREGGLLTSMPWGKVTLIDFYIGILIFATWVWHREQNKTAAGAWLLAFVFMGNLATACYLLKAVIEANGDMQCLMFGKSHR